MKIIQNAIKTPDGTILVSFGALKAEHIDKLNNEYYEVKGGFSKIIRNDVSDYIELSILEKEPFESIRIKLLIIESNSLDFLYDINTSKLKILLNTNNPMVLRFSKFIYNEINYRRKYKLKKILNKQ